jgi:hypothetical protein
VDQEVAQFEHGIVQIVAKHLLAEMLHKNLADRTSAVEDAAIVARAGPQLIAALRIVDQRAEERGFQCLGILLKPAHQISGNEFRSFFGKEDVAVDIVEHLDRDILQTLAPHQYDDRQFEAAPAHQIDQGCGLTFEPLLAPIHHHAADRRIGLHRHLGILDPSRPHHLETELLDLGGDLRKPQPFQVFTVECRRAEQDSKMPEEIHAAFLTFPSLHRRHSPGNGSSKCERDVGDASYKYQSM